MAEIDDRSPFYQKLSLNLLSISLLITGLYLGQGLLLPLFFSILLASLLLPVKKFFDRRKIPHTISILLALFFSLIVIVGIAYFLLSQISNFLEDVDTIGKRLEELSVVIQKWVKEQFNVTIRKQNQYINETAQKMKDSGADLVGQTFLTLTQSLSYVVLLPVYTFLILYYKNHLKAFMIAAFRNSDESKIRDILTESQSISQSYIGGLMIEMIIVFALNAIGFLILGIKYAIFLALITAMLNLIPYVGILVANIFCVLITLISCESLRCGNVLWVFVVIAVVQFIDNNFLMPLIVGSKVRINALAVIVGVLVGGVLCGVPGMFLAIPGLAVLKVIFDRVAGLEPFGILLGDDTPASKPRKWFTSKKNTS